VAALAQSAGALVPALRGATVLGHRSGQVPQRPEIRLDVVRRQGAEDAREAVVHCYGHGDSGVTTSWGCADAVAALVAECR
ncbi:MAG: FAD-binding oxidoreductase, partial [Actinomycetales bacterium]|nr:FAD-binding oxidoreductase [Actinomycetales bacterium]